MNKSKNKIPQDGEKQNLLLQMHLQTTLTLDRANVLVKENFARHLSKGLCNEIKFKYLRRNLTSIRKSTIFSEPFADPKYFLKFGHLYRSLGWNTE